MLGCKKAKNEWPAVNSGRSPEFATLQTGKNVFVGLNCLEKMNKISQRPKMPFFSCVCSNFV